MANNIELRFDPISGSWRYWDNVANQFADPQPTDPAADNLIVLNGDVPSGEFYSGGAGSDSYLVTSDFDQAITISDAYRDTVNDTYNVVRFEQNLGITSVQLADLGLLGQAVQVTLTSSNVITVQNLSTFRFQVYGDELLTAAEFVGLYSTTFAGSNVEIDAFSGAYTILNTDGANTHVGAPVTATDNDGDPVTYSMSAEGVAAGFDIDSASGQISYVSANTLTVDDVYTFNVIASSIGAGGTVRETTQEVTITVVYPPEDAQFAPLAGDFSMFLGEDGSTSPINLGAPVTASDINGDAIVYSLDAASLAAGFIIDATTAQLSYAGAPNTIQQAGGSTFTVVVQATSIGATSAPVVVSQNVPVLLLDNLVSGTSGADVLDNSASTAALFIETGDGDDQIIAGTSNDVIKGGAGNDRIDIGAGGKDRVAMSVSFEGASLDGGDEISGFETGDDIVQFDKAQGDTYNGAGTEPVTTAEWLASVTGDDNVALNGDDLLIVSPIVELATDNTPTVVGLRFHFREGSLYNNGQSVASSTPEVIFETPMSAADFLAAIGGETNYDADLMAIIDLNVGLRGLLGRDGIRYGADVVVKTSLTHADVVSALANDEDLWNWDVSAITSGDNLFYDVAETNTDILEFDQDISGWDVSGFTSMHSMFRAATNFNQDIGDWDVGNVLTFTRMFYEARTFNQDISDWNINADATQMAQIFHRAEAFNQNVGKWNVAKVENFAASFQYARVFNQDIGVWDVGSAKFMFAMFYGAWDFNQDISGWDTSGVSDMRKMFFGAQSFNQNLGDWDISSLTQASEMFQFYGLTSLSVENLDATLRGWARLDTAAGETAIQNDVIFGASGQTYSAATTVEYFETEYNWTFEAGMIFDSANAYQGTNAADLFNADVASQQRSFHGLAGNDTLNGTTNDEHFYGGAGDDTLTGGGGNDVFHYLYANAGNDTIADFDVNNDKVALSHLLLGYAVNATLSDFVQASDNASGGTVLSIDANGDTLGTDITIELSNVTYSASIVDDLVAAEALVLV